MIGSEPGVTVLQFEMSFEYFEVRNRFAEQQTECTNE
jgi:hypothetical protein